MRSDGLFQHVLFQAGDAHQRAKVVVGQQIEVIADDQMRASFEAREFRWRELRELDEQAVAEVAGGHADRIEALDALEHRLDLFLGRPPRRPCRRSMSSSVHGEVAGVVDGIDDGGGDGAIRVGRKA
jgi:hypothetical protein